MADDLEQIEPCELLPWDSNFFAARIARARVDHLTANLNNRIEQWCQRERVDCLYFLARPDDPSLAPLARQHGYDLVDVRLTLERLVTDAGCAHSAPSVRPATREDLPRLKSIASVSHRHSRFYSDLHFPNERCDAFYQCWIESCVTGPDDTVFVSNHAGTADGYATCNLLGESMGRIGLVAVDPQARGAGVGRGLIQQSLEWLNRQGVSRVRVTTQARNIPAQRLYQSCGFRTVEVGLYYHRWFSRPD